MHRELSWGQGLCLEGSSRMPVWLDGGNSGDESSQAALASCPEAITHEPLTTSLFTMVDNNRGWGP